MTPSRRRQKPGRRNAEWLWAILAFGVACLCLTVGLVAQSRSGPTIVEIPAPGLTLDEEARAGSILVIPTRGNDCEHLLFDNRTGQILHAGSVACEIALARNGNMKSKGWSLARTEAIRGGFRWKDERP
jgi:hypothetical protein